MSGIAQVVIQNQRAQSVNVSVLNEGNAVTNVKLGALAATEPVPFGRVTAHTRQLADAGHISLRSV